MIIHRYAQGGEGSVNSYWLEGERTVVIVDAQRLISSARRILGDIRETGKAVTAVVLTHGHPDHIGGLATFTAAYPDAQVLALPGTAQEMRSDPHGWIRLAQDALGPDYPTQVTLPTGTLRDGERVTFGDLALEVVDAGPGEAGAMAMFFAPVENALLSGDVVQHGMTAFLVEGRLGAWLDQIDRFTPRFPATTLYPGHGEVGPARELFARQREYLTAARDLVQGALRNGRLFPGGRAAVVAEMSRRYPGYLPVAEVDDLIGLNADAVAREVQQDGTPVRGGSHAP